MLPIQLEEEDKAQANKQRELCASHNPKTSTEQLHPERSLQRDATMKHNTRWSSMPAAFPQLVRTFCKASKLYQGWLEIGFFLVFPLKLFVFELPL